MCETMCTFGLPSCPGSGCRVCDCAPKGTATRITAPHAHDTATLIQYLFLISFSAPSTSDLSCSTRSARVYRNGGHHSGFHVLAYVTVEHPSARVGQIDQ